MDNVQFLDNLGFETSSVFLGMEFASIKISI